jgi:hypothetical protein
MRVVECKRCGHEFNQSVEDREERGDICLSCWQRVKGDMLPTAYHCELAVPGGAPPQPDLDSPRAPQDVFMFPKFPDGAKEPLLGPFDFTSAGDKCRNCGREGVISDFWLDGLCRECWEKKNPPPVEGKCTNGIKVSTHTHSSSEKCAGGCGAVIIRGEGFYVETPEGPLCRECASKGYSASGVPKDALPRALERRLFEDFIEEYEASGSDTAPKETSGKPTASAVPMDILIKYLAPAYEEGFIRYVRESWRKGFPVSRMIDAARRHEAAFFHGKEDWDPDAAELGVKKHHLAGAIFSLICILQTLETRPELDDR